ncbi:hypothetical protein [Halomonas lysinitropha]|uniref:Oxidoreductase molybdopterin-binding domain-containing protein n=1 Tax=Halomonas lysinitropha TaxID=2607506 RepID=A0A5K1I4M9_9GAMM|nr:hypothetical protein [Halomonas lysinitropha]VVZ94943.1 hypothetical protein HALO32_01007 [Halomonas lysinitropha]
MPSDSVLKCLVCVPLRRAVLACLLAVMWPAGLALASPEVVVFQQGEQETRLPVAELRNRADVRFTFFDPYLAEEVEVTGLVFRELLEEQFGEVPERLAFTAWDDYEVTLGGWDDPNWILVTHQDGRPIGLRERGPVRLVERDYGSRDTANLRNFNDWVWMIRRIEAQQ